MFTGEDTHRSNHQTLLFLGGSFWFIELRGNLKLGYPVLNLDIKSLNCLGAIIELNSWARHGIPGSASKVGESHMFAQVWLKRTER